MVVKFKNQNTVQVLGYPLGTNTCILNFGGGHFCLNCFQEMAGKQYEVYVHKGKPIWKIITGILFSHLGLFVLCIGYGAMGE